VSERERLPNRRFSETFSFDCNGLRYVATISRFANGRISELFLNNHKGGSHADANARDAAIILSFAIQCGANIDAIRRALSRDSRGRANSPVGEALDILNGGST
jgi:hypothetical protein